MCSYVTNCSANAVSCRVRVCWLADLWPVRADLSSPEPSRSWHQRRARFSAHHTSPLHLLLLLIPPSAPSRCPVQAQQLHRNILAALFSFSHLLLHLLPSLLSNFSAWGVKGSAQCQRCAVILTCFHFLHKNPHNSTCWTEWPAVEELLCSPLTRWLCLMKMMLLGCSSCPVQWARWQRSKLSGLICSFVQAAHLGLKWFCPKQDNAWADDTLRCEHDIFGSLVKRGPLSPVYYFTFDLMGGNIIRKWLRDVITVHSFTQIVFITVK